MNTKKIREKYGLPKKKEDLYNQLIIYKNESAAYEKVLEHLANIGLIGITITDVYTQRKFGKYKKISIYTGKDKNDLCLSRRMYDDEKINYLNVNVRKEK